MDINQPNPRWGNFNILAQLSNTVGGAFNLNLAPNRHLAYVTNSSISRRHLVHYVKNYLPLVGGALKCSLTADQPQHEPKYP